MVSRFCQQSPTQSLTCVWESAISILVTVVGYPLLALAIFILNPLRYMMFYFFHNLQPISYLFVIWLKTIIMSLLLMINVLYRTRKLESHEWDQEWTTVYYHFKSPGSCFFMQYFKIPIQKNNLYLWQCIQGHLYFKKLPFKLNSDIFDNKFYVSSHNDVFHSC